MIATETIQEMANKIAQRFEPQRVVLFGSYARGEATENSDIDLLVVLDGPVPRGKRGAPIIRMLAQDYVLPVDVIVRSEETFQQWKDVPGSFLKQVLEEGIILYERSK